MDTYSCCLRRFLRTQCQFNSCRYRCYAHLATDGTNHRNWISDWNSRPEFVQESYHQLPHYHHSQRCYSYRLLFTFAYHRSTIRNSCTHIAHTLRCVDSTLWRCSRYFGNSYKRQKQRDTGCCDCYSPNATTLYGGLRTCNGQHILLLGCLLSLLHQYCFHRFHHLHGRSFNALPS